MVLCLEYIHASDSFGSPLNRKQSHKWCIDYSPEKKNGRNLNIIHSEWNIIRTKSPWQNELQPFSRGCIESWVVAFLRNSYGLHFTLIYSYSWVWVYVEEIWLTNWETWNHMKTAICSLYINIFVIWYILNDISYIWYIYICSISFVPGFLLSTVGVRLTPAP